MHFAVTGYLGLPYHIKKFSTSQYSTEILVFLIEARCVLFEVGTEVRLQM